MMFCYNTSFQISIKQTPNFLLCGDGPNMSSLPTPKGRRKITRGAKEDENHQTLVKVNAKDIARRKKMKMHRQTQTKKKLKSLSSQLSTQPTSSARQTHLPAQKLQITAFWDFH